MMSKIARILIPLILNPPHRTTVHSHGGVLASGLEKSGTAPQGRRFNLAPEDLAVPQQLALLNRTAKLPRLSVKDRPS